uniref:Odorant Binding Protein 26 n=1 Tax=Dendrolimus punctatus TaxID=238572 RepID=A0A2K8GKM6_9NEOP|nr:Odorant Binding Protein 26 [Dendrolimus punctatus]
MSLITKIVFILVLGFAASQIEKRRPIKFCSDITAKIKEICFECIKETNNTEHAWILFKEHRHDDSDCFKRFIYCSSTKSGYYSENGVPILDKLYNLFTDSDVRDVLKECRDCLNITTPIETANNFYKCYLKNSPAYMSFT